MNFSAREPLKLILPSFDESNRYLVLEDVCADCEGKGERPNYDRYNKTCGYCNGFGVILNDNGKVIIQLISDHMKSNDSNVILAQRNL